VLFYIMLVLLALLTLITLMLVPKPQKDPFEAKDLRTVALCTAKKCKTVEVRAFRKGDYIGKKEKCLKCGKRTAMITQIYYKSEEDEKELKKIAKWE